MTITIGYMHIERSVYYTH